VHGRADVIRAEAILLQARHLWHTRRLTIC